MSTIFADSRMEVGKYRHVDINRFNVVLFCLRRLTLGRTRKVIPQPWNMGGGGGVDVTPPVGFLICCNISKRFCLQWKAFNLLYKVRPPSWILSRIRNQVKTVRIVKYSKYSKLVSKCARKINEQLQKTSSADVLSSRGKKIRKPCWRLPTRQLASLSSRVRRES